MESSVITTRNILNMHKIKEIKHVSGRTKTKESKHEGNLVARKRTNNHHGKEILERYCDKMIESPCEHCKYNFFNLISANKKFWVLYDEKENGNIETNYHLIIYVPRIISLLAKVSLELKDSSKEVGNSVIKRIYLNVEGYTIFDTEFNDIDFKNIFPSINHNNPVFCCDARYNFSIHIIFSEDLKHYYNHINIDLCLDYIRITNDLRNKFLEYKKIKINETITMENGALKLKDINKEDFLITSDEEKSEILFENNSLMPQNRTKMVRFITKRNRDLGFFSKKTYKIKLYNSYDEEEYFDVYFANMYCYEASDKKNFIKHQKEIIIDMASINCRGSFRSIVYQLKKNIKKALYVTIDLHYSPEKK